IHLLGLGDLLHPLKLKWRWRDAGEIVVGSELVLAIGEVLDLTKHELADVGGTLDGACSATGFVQSGEQNAYQQRDDPDDDQELDQGEPRRHRRWFSLSARASEHDQS